MSSTSERKRYHKDNAPTDDILTLINLVRQNPALYNYKLQPNQRRRSDILSGWQEVAQQIGNKYTVQEVRRKWKNLRDTYHQYRLRTPKCIEGRLSKWRYSKELEFLSKVYQPKLKSQRNLSFDASTTAILPIGAMLKLKMKPESDLDDDDVVDDDGHSDTALSHHAASQITLVSDETETFILTAYEESVADDVVPHPHHHQHLHHQQQHSHHHHHHQSQHDGSISSIELSHIAPDDVVDDDVDDDVCDEGQVVGIVKHELDEDGATGAEVDYEEVCLYEEAGGAHTSVDCEMGVGDVVDGSSDVADSKGFHYIDAHNFCITDIEPQTVVSRQHHHHFTTNSGGAAHTSNSNSVLAGDVKLKNLTLVTTSASASAAPSSQLSLVDVTEATSTSVTISTTAAMALTAATVTTTTAAAALCNTTSFTSAPTTATILQLPPLTAVSAGSAAAASNSVSAAASSTLITDLEQQQAYALAKRDELDLFFDFLKKKMQCFSKTQITHIQMEFLNCVMRQEAAEQDTKD